MSANVYLHHYPPSLFSEKIRLMLGYLGVPWRSVEITSIMPRPLLMPLTGGYRKTPTLQIGANVYCDTAVITAVLVRLTGNRSLYAPGFVAERVAEWADSTLFRTTVALNFRPEAIGGFMSRLSPEEVAAFQADRAELSGTRRWSACRRMLQSMRSMLISSGSMSHSAENFFLRTNRAWPTLRFITACGLWLRTALMPACWNPMASSQTGWRGWRRYPPARIPRP